MFRLFLNIFLAFFLLLSNSYSAQSQTKSKKDFLFRYNEELSEIENYLQNIKYLSADFSQISPEGNVVDGKFYLSRPGKMMVKYNDPAKILIVVNGSVLAYQDLELEETSYLTTGRTPASFLTRDNISFSAKDVEITDFIKENNSVRVSVMKKNNKESGEFSLIFGTNPLRFLKMEVKNDLGETTIVALSKIKLGEKIDDNLFIIKDNKIPK